MKEREESLRQKIKAIVQCSDCVSICVCVCVSLSLSLFLFLCVCLWSISSALSKQTKPYQCSSWFTTSTALALVKLKLLM